MFLRRIFSLSAIVAAVACSPSLGAAELPAHPRLLFSTSEEAVVAKKISSDPLAAQLQKNILARADATLKERTCRYEKYDGKRLLPESRLALHNILHTGWAWRTTKKKEYFDRTLREMDAICAMVNWNPDHFLDTAEMSTALAIGYDWLYPKLNDKQRNHYAKHLLDKGLAMIEGKIAKNRWWQGPSNNWSQVCGTGMAFAAIALHEREPQRCDRVIEQSSKLLSQCETFYQPDGAYPEGPDYWHYGTNYQTLHQALDFLPQNQKPLGSVWRRTAEFVIHNIGPTGICFNYADGGMRKNYPTAAQSFLASKFPESDLPNIARAHLKAYLDQPFSQSGNGDVRFHPLHLLWLPIATTQRQPARTYDLFRGQQDVAFARTNWTSNASWLAIKGGTGAASHGHLDVGSFVYESQGHRWFIDMGKEGYNLPGYFGKQRWDYFRLNNRSHNTLVINDKIQSTPAKGCPISPWKSVNDSGIECSIDLSTAYSGQVDKATRMVRFNPTSGETRITDVILKPRGPVRWAVVIDSAFTIQGKTITLTNKGKKLTLTRHDSLGGDWQEFSLKPPTSAENPNKGYRMIGFTVPAGEKLSLEVSWR